MTSFAKPFCSLKLFSGSLSRFGQNLTVRLVWQELLQTPADSMSEKHPEKPFEWSHFIKSLSRLAARAGKGQPQKEKRSFRTI